MPYYIQYELRNESDREFINLKTTFGNYESPAYVNLVYIKDPVTGLVTPEVDVGEDIFLDDVNKCNTIPVLYGGETLHIGRFGPGESLFGTYKTIFNAPDDPDKYYYKLVDAVATALEGADTGVQVHISPIPGHITKTNVEYRIIENKWGDPVDTTTGAFTDSINAMSLKCDPAISFDLQYNSLSEKSGECGN